MYNGLSSLLDKAEGKHTPESPLKFIRPSLDFPATKDLDRLNPEPMNGVRGKEERAQTHTHVKSILCLPIQTYPNPNPTSTDQPIVTPNPCTNNPLRVFARRFQSERIPSRRRVKRVETLDAILGLTSCVPRCSRDMD